MLFIKLNGNFPAVLYNESTFLHGYLSLLIPTNEMTRPRTIITESSPTFAILLHDGIRDLTTMLSL